MSKKINPTSLKIGAQLNWTQKSQNYSCTKSSSYFWINFQNFFILPNPQSFLLDKWNLEVFSNIQKLSVFLHTKTPKQNLLIEQSSYGFASVNTKIPYLYNNLNFLLSVNFIGQYIALLLKNKHALRKIIPLITLMVKSQLNSQKIVVTKRGARCVQLEGFKLTFAGRFESSSTQMAKSIKQSIGSVPLTKLSNYIEFISIPVFFKLGSCTLKIWIFYSYTT